MTTLERREECPRDRSRKGHFRALCAHQMEIGPFRRRWKHRGQNRFKSCRGRPLGL